MNLLNLTVQTTDIRVGDIRYLFQHQVFHLGLRNDLKRIARLAVNHHRVPRLRRQIPRQRHHKFLAVGIRGQNALPIRQHLTNIGDVAAFRITAVLHDYRALIQTHLRARPKRPLVNLRLHPQTHPTITGKHLCRAFLRPRLKENPVRARRLQHVLHVLAQQL